MGIIVLGAVITPSADPFSLSIISIPLYFLYEISIFTSAVVLRKKLEAGSTGKPNMMPTIAIGADHAGFEFKEVLKKWLEKNAYKTKDFGTYNTESADYPDFAHPVAGSGWKERVWPRSLLCGSANGVAITANKHQGIRAAICWNEELAALARQHNNANVLCIPRDT